MKYLLLGLVFISCLTIIKTQGTPPYWWQYAVVYQVYPRSLQDSDGDGIGDIKGIISRLDYFESLGVKALWLSPVYESPMADFGYDISNFTSIDPIFGTMEDFENLTREAGSKGIGIIMDLVPNHSSDEHEWFIKSVAREDPYTDYYVWQPSKGINITTGEQIPPNNWLSEFDGSAWQWNAQRGEFYLHQFDEKQPDLNYRNPLIIEEYKNILKFWMDKGVAGFRFDAIPYLFEDPNFPDEPLSGQAVPPDDYDYLNHIYTKNLPETPYTLSIFYEYIRNYSVNALDGIYRVMMLEGYLPVDELFTKYYANVSDFPFNFLFITDINNSSNARDVENVILTWVKNTTVPDIDYWPNWVLGNHDRSRVKTRLGISDGAFMSTMLLPGTYITYYGEEIGMEDTYIPPELVVDPAGFRDPFRTSMQWNNQTYAGFSNSTPWLPVNQNYLTLNVEYENTATESVLKNYRQLINLRNQNSIKTGELQTSVIPNTNENILATARVIRNVNEPSYLILFNWGSQLNYIINIASSSFDFPINNPEVVIRTVGSNIILGPIDLSNVNLDPKEGCVIQFTAA